MKRTEQEEIKRDKAKAVKNSGRGLRKGDASLNKFLLDYKHNEKTFNFYDERLYEELLTQFDENPLINNPQSTMNATFK